MPGSGTDRTQTRLEGGPAIILVAPQLAENIGMCARAMANFGLSELRLVAPRDGWPKKGVRSAASGAAYILDGAKLFGSVAEAIADLNLVYATTARDRHQLKPVLTPGAAIDQMASGLAGGSRAGILFGRERNGLTNDEVSLADVAITFQVSPAYASLNLAQAVLLIGYEWFRVSHAAAHPLIVPDAGPLAAKATLLSFIGYVETELAACNYFLPVERKEIMARNLRNVLHRMQLTEQDVRTLRGAITTLVQGRRARVPKARPDAAAAAPPAQDTPK
ncbi:tRNA/rRNA methyltransferase [Rhizobiales bacterium GAS113]|nr:tRNA/rRNA methyltransferase [Rhizobiales bacterium GAS113]